MSAGLLIRPARPADLNQVMVLERETPTAPHWLAADYAGILCATCSGILRRCLLVATDERAGDLIEGFAVGKALGSRPQVEAEIESVVVRAAIRRSGLGTALCRAVMQWSRQQGAPAIELEVRAHSVGAIQLYSGLGFVQTGRRPHYYSLPEDDAIAMRCALGPPPGRDAAVVGDSLTGWLDV